MSSSKSKPGTSTNAEVKVSEYVIRAPPADSDNKKFSIIQFQNIDLTKYKTAQIERENNIKNYKLSHNVDQMPKFGSGSEYGREAKDEARRKKFGIRTKKYNIEDQPYILKCGTGKESKRFKSQQVGSIQSSANYYVFTQCNDGAFQIKPVDQYHKLTQLSTYKTLDPEEAEKQFEQRTKTMNYFSIMVQKKMTGDDQDIADGDDDDDPTSMKANKKKDAKKADKNDRKSFHLTEMDSWVKNDSDMSSPDDSDDDGAKKTTKAKKKKQKSKKKKKENSDEEALEESDEFDEGKEVDYMTSSDSNDDMMYSDKTRDNSKYEEKGVEDEDGLRTLVESDQSDEEDEEKKKKTKTEEVAQPLEEEVVARDSSSESSDSDSDSDFEKNPNFSSAVFMQNKVFPDDANQDSMEAHSMNNDDKSGKRKYDDQDQDHDQDGLASSQMNSDSTSAGTSSVDAMSPTKRVRVDGDLETVTSLGSDEKTFITPDSIRRYLQRKPMTTADLIQKFKYKNTGLTKQNLVQTIVQTLKQVKYETMKSKEGKMLFYVKD